MSDDLNDLINKQAKGKRPQFLGTKAEEHLMSMVMALMQELAVTRERLDTVERLLDQKSLVAKPEVDGFEPDAEAETERQTAQHQLIATVMRSLEQEVQALRDADAADAGALHLVADDEGQVA